MNHSQKKYAADRVNEIKLRKIKEITAAHTSKARLLSVEQKRELVERGAVNLLAGVNDCCRWTNAFDFSGYEFPSTFDRETAEPLIAAVTAEATRIIDELLLGDASEALEAIRRFEQM